MIDKKRVKVIGFDLDGTLYPETTEINDRIRLEIAKYLLNKKPSLQDLENAKKHFEERFAIHQSGRKVLEEAGYSNSSIIMDECIARAEVSDLIKEDLWLTQFLLRINSNYQTFLLTSSPQEASRKKMKSLGINAHTFDHAFYSDTPEIGYKTDGSAFQNATRLMNVDPRKCLYIGNSAKADIIPARRIGMQTIAVWSEIPEADISLKSLRDLEEILT